MYADADFFFALLKKEDWLKKRAEALYQDHRKELWTSVATMIELFYKGTMKGIDITEALFALQNLIPVVPLTKEHLLTAAQIKVQHPKFDVMDAIHAGVAQSMGETTIISSDKIFDVLALKRIRLED